MELWIPVPQSNEVQTISNLKYDMAGLNHELKIEHKHNNKYLYIYSNEGIAEIKNIKMSFNVLRKEHSNVKYKNVDPKDYLNSYSQVPTGNIFSNIIVKCKTKFPIKRFCMLKKIDLIRKKKR